MGIMDYFLLEAYRKVPKWSRFVTLQSLLMTSRNSMTSY